MRAVPVTISVVASVGVAMGSWGMAHATTPHGAHGQLGVDPSAGPERVITAADVARITEDGRLPRLRGKVDAARNITISNDHVAAGTYKLIINDSTSSHNWHIFGTGVDKKTTIRGTGTFRFRVHLSAGTYNVRCDRHPTTMKFQVVVT